MTDPRIELAQDLADDPGGILAALDGVRLIIEADPARLLRNADQAALVNLVNLAGRLFGHVDLQIDGDAPLLVDRSEGGPSTLREHLEQLHGAIGPEPTAQPTRELRLAWGCAPTGPGLAGDGAGWSYSVGPQWRPLDRAPGPAPGALAASSFMVAQAFGGCLSETASGFAFHATRGFTANLLDYRNRAADAALGVPLRLGEAVLAGAGSVGSSVQYCAELLGISGGPLEYVDPDRFGDRNPLRYPILRADAGDPKATWLAARSGDLEVVGHECDIATFIAGHPEPPRIGLLAVSVDTPEGRRDAADALARVTLNAGVAGLRLHVSRHGFGDTGCAYCQYVDLASPLSASAQLAQRVGLTVEQVLAIQVERHGVLSDSDAAALRATGSPCSANARAGERLADIDRRAYAQAEVTVHDQPVRVAAPFVSSMSGLLLLVEMLKEADDALTRHRLKGRVDIDMSGEPTGHVRANEPDRTGRCLCHSAFRRRAHARLHSSPMTLAS